MTRESKSRKKVEEIMRNGSKDFRLKQEEVPGFRCDFCDQWYADKEGVDCIDYTRNATATVDGLPSEKVRLYELLEYLKPIRVHNTLQGETIRKAGTNETFYAGYEFIEEHNVRALRDALKEYVESRGGPSYETLDDRNLEAAAVTGRHDEPQEGDILFEFDLDLSVRVRGETEHMCQFCDEARE